jgi:hypothetical protein
MVALAGALVLAGCGSARPAAATTPLYARTARVVTGPLSTSFVNARGSWAIVPMGGSVAGNETFWELFTEPEKASGWSEVTPPGVADNGGLVAASQQQATSVTIGFRASQGLVFSPTATSADAGRTWAPDVLEYGLADTPDALSTGTSGESAALFGNGVIATQAAPGGAWSPVTTVGQLAASPAGRMCQLTGVDAVAVDQQAGVLVGGDCARPGIAGILSYAGGSWTYDPPRLPGQYGGDQIQVLRMSSQALLLRAGTDLLILWRTTSGWSAPAVLAGAGPAMVAAGFGSGLAAWVLLSGGRAQTITGPSGSWQQLPAVPAGTAALAQDESPAGQGLDALAVSGDTLTVWRDTARTWAKAQAINVPIVAGSSS